uniref:Glucagon like peptide 1 receptor n=1 Tax=Cyanistes caeruleus TaxID=156563 RepID=A0A8C0U5S2_CYACU
MPFSPLGFSVLLLATVGRSLPVRRSSDGSLSEVVQKWKEYQLQCQKYLYETPPIVPEGKFCNRTFDDYACWPDGLPGTYVNVSCPWYLPWANAVMRELTTGCGCSSSAWTGVSLLHLGWDLAAEGEFHSALEEPV